MKKISDNSYIVNIILINVDDGTERPLYERENSRCHFSDEFSYDDYKIRFRLDWGDIENGEPVLKADISLDSKPKKKLKGPWHHIWKNLDPHGSYIYDFEFKGLKFRFLAKKTIQHNISSDATVSASRAILIIDENADHEPYDKVKRLLKKLGSFEILTASCGEDGISLIAIEGKRPDIILLDLLTPFERGKRLRIGEGLREKKDKFVGLTEDDAFDIFFPKISPAEKFLEKLREKGLLDSTQVILLSGIGGFEDSKARVLRFFLEYGVEFCVENPSTYAESKQVVKTIEQCLKKKH